MTIESKLSFLYNSVVSDELNNFAWNIICEYLKSKQLILSDEIFNIQLMNMTEYLFFRPKITYDERNILYLVLDRLNPYFPIQTSLIRYVVAWPGTDDKTIIKTLDDYSAYRKQFRLREEILTEKYLQLFKR